MSMKLGGFFCIYRVKASDASSTKMDYFPASTNLNPIGLKYGINQISHTKILNL